MRLLRVSNCVRLRASRCCPVCLALKWFCPGLRATSLPFLVTLIRLVNDLFVFIKFEFFDRASATKGEWQSGQNIPYSAAKVQRAGDTFTVQYMKSMS